MQSPFEQKWYRASYGGIMADMMARVAASPFGQGTHTHGNFPVLASLSILNEKGRDYLLTNSRLIAAATADRADDADLWAGNRFADYLNQGVRTTDEVLHASVSSPIFVSGFAGNGWQIDSEAHATVDYLTVRKELSVYSLLVQQVRASSGSLWVSDSAKITAVTDGGTYYKCFMETDGGALPIPFAVGDWLRCQQWTGQDVKYYTARVTGIGIDSFNLAKSDKDGEGLPAAGDEVVRVGSADEPNRQGSLYLTSADDGSPYLDVLDGVSTPSLSGKTKVRLGRLDGITDAAFGGALTGYGLYADSAYIKGKIIVTGGNAATITDVMTVSAQVGGLQSQITANAQAITLKASAAEVNALGTRVGGVESTLTVHAGQIAAKASQSTVDGLTGRLTTAESALTVQAGQIAAKASQTSLDALSGRVSTTESSLSVQAGQIALKVGKDGVISSINQSAEAIKIAASKITIDGTTTFSNGYDPTKLKVGGRNLLPGSRELSLVAPADNNSRFYPLPVVLKPNTEYTLSVEEVVKNFGFAIGSTVLLYDVAQNKDVSIGVLNMSNVRQSFPFKTPVTGSYKVLLYAGIAGSTAGNSFTWRQLQLEEGNTPTAWQPAPEDQAAGYRNLVPNSLIKCSTRYYGDFNNSVYLEAGKTYTFSAQGAVDAATVAAGRSLRLFINTPDWSWTRTLVITSRDMTLVYATFQAPVTGRYDISAYNYPSLAQATNDVWVEYYKVEEGELATPWQPAAEDLQAGGANLFYDTQNPNLSSPYWAEGSNGASTYGMYTPKIKALKVTTNWGRLWPKYSVIPWNYKERYADNVFTFSAMVARDTSYEGEPTLCNLWNAGSYATIKATLGGVPINPNSFLLPMAWTKLEITFRRTSADVVVPRLEPWCSNYSQCNPCMVIHSMKLERGYFATPWQAAADDFGYLASAMQQDTTIVGGLITSGVIRLGEGGVDRAGINGIGTSESEVRIWAGTSFANRWYAPYRVLQNGKFYATNAEISGKIESNSDGARISIDPSARAIRLIRADGVEVGKWDFSWANGSIINVKAISGGETWSTGLFGGGVQCSISPKGTLAQLSDDLLDMKYVSDSGKPRFYAYLNAYNNRLDLILKNLPTSVSGLSSGQVWRSGNALYIVP